MFLYKREIQEQLGQLNYILTKHQKRKYVLLFIIMLVNSWFELLGIAALLPFIEVIMTPEVIMENEHIKPILIFFNITTSTETIIFVGILVALVYIIKNVYTLLASFYNTHFTTKVGMQLSIQMLRAYMKRPYSYYHQISSADVMRGVGYECSCVSQTLQHIYYLLTEIISFITISVYIVITDWKISVGTIVILLITLFVIVKVFKPISVRLGKKSAVANTRVNKALLQITGGIKELYVTGRKEIFMEEYIDANNMARNASRNNTFISTAPDRIIEGICVSGLVLVIIVRLIIAPTEMASFIPVLAAFAMGAFKMLPSIGKISNRITGIAYCGPGVANVYKNLMESAEEERKMIEYVAEHGDQTMSDPVGGLELEFKDILEVSDITWQYAGAESPVLDGLNLKVKRGEAIAFIGPSGSGKTTLSDVILGLLQPQKGGVYMDGIDVYTMPHTWARIIGYVPQSVFLMDDTVRANVAFGVKDYTDEEIWDALDRAALGDFIRSLPEGLDTMVGERGVRFSGGQRQRIAIARALFAKPQILVLDEATSALDNEAEKAIMESIDALQGQMTLIIVAHRLTTIKNCNHIYRIQDGVAIEQDKAEVLMRR